MRSGLAHTNPHDGHTNDHHDIGGGNDDPDVLNGDDRLSGDDRLNGDDRLSGDVLPMPLMR